jgi:hypothetical protein
MSIQTFLAGDDVKTVTMPNGRELVLPSGFMPQGYNVEADVITTTADGRSLNDLWTEFTDVVRIHNERRQTLIDLMTFPVVNVIEDVPVSTGDDFEEASEFGVPKGTRTTLNYFSMAYDFKWYDIATRYTWKFLAEAPAQQVEAIHQGVLEADNRLVFKKVMNTLFRNTNRTANITGNNYTVYALYNADGTVPPDYKSNTFSGTHTHYLTSGAATIDSQDVEAMFDHLRHHGYGEANGTQMVLLTNQAEADTIRTWRAGVANANSQVAKYDFIPATRTTRVVSARAFASAAERSCSRSPQVRTPSRRPTREGSERIMSRQIDLTQELSDEDRGWLEARGDVAALRSNAAVVEGREYVVREEPEVPSTEELSAKVAADMVEEQKRQEDGLKRDQQRQEQLNEERLADLRAKAEEDLAARQDAQKEATGQSTPVASKATAKRS